MHGSARPAQPNIPEGWLCDTNHVQESTARTTPLLTSARRADQVQRVVSREKRSPPEQQAFQTNQAVSALYRLNKDEVRLDRVGYGPVCPSCHIECNRKRYMWLHRLSAYSAKELKEPLTPHW